MRFGAASMLVLALAACGEREARNMSVEEVAGELSHMRIEPGLWELTSEVLEVRGPDLPREVRNRMVGPRPRLRHCITPEQAARPSANFLAGRPDRGCVYRALSARDGRVTGETICPDARTRMDGRYGPRAYDMRMEMESPIPGGEAMTLELRARGRRIGDCPEGAKG